MSEETQNRRLAEESQRCCHREPKNKALDPLMFVSTLTNGLNHDQTRSRIQDGWNVFFSGRWLTFSLKTHIPNTYPVYSFIYSSNHFIVVDPSLYYPTIFSHLQLTRSAAAAVLSMAGGDTNTLPCGAVTDGPRHCPSGVTDTWHTALGQPRCQEARQH